MKENYIKSKVLNEKGDDGLDTHTMAVEDNNLLLYSCEDKEK